MRRFAAWDASGWRHRRSQGPQTAGGWALLSAYSLFTVACVTICTTSIRRALGEAELTPPTLTISSVVAVTATVAIRPHRRCSSPIPRTSGIGSSRAGSFHDERHLVAIDRQPPVVWRGKMGR